MPIEAKTRAELIVNAERMKDVLEKIKHVSFDSGRDGCTYGDTDYDSLSVVYGYNNAVSEFKQIADEALNPTP